jgi:hypothetical protein
MSEERVEAAIPQILEELIFLRDYAATDEALVYQTWLKGLYYGNDWFGAINRLTFETNYRKVITHLLAHSTIICACLQEDPDVVLGYSVVDHSMTTLHWIYVKTSWRKLGIAKKLIPPQINRTTHLTQMGKWLKPKDWDFNPFME